MNQLSIPAAQSLWTALHAEDGAGNWMPPAQPSGAMLSQARTALAAMPTRLQPATKQVKADWLIALGIATAGQMTADDAERKVSLYIDMLDHEAGCFSKDSLRAAAGAFKWFPSFAEVKAVLDAERFRLRKEAARLKRLLEPRALPPGNPAPVTPESIAAREAAMRKIGIL
ncbi:MAG: hypothetical protein OJJ21_17015 [Ferrovibrio sp.]|uniref:hypothetical protein n=1 Tax=Ferrovibrio sp. TaxID=1917215 RepID=UPI00260BF0CF|nr:hypothetical protein [Ferrovibrio sp.]MCW0235303.1 hypothetical protein [Ferrovibrio sp.]